MVHTAYYREYHQLLVVRETDSDAQRTVSMEAAESCLWEELSTYHISLAHAGLPAEYAHDAYKVELGRRRDAAICCAVRDIRNDQLTACVRMELLHGHRRTLAILQQEEELVHMIDRSARAVAEDQAFVALGRRSVQVWLFSYT